MSDKLLSKIVKKNYNNRLEEVLSKKDFTLDVKNTLLSIFYKIENGYNDYKTIKRDTFDKKEYIEKLIFVIDKDCEKIEFISKNNNQEEKADKEKKEIVCYPIENNILYYIAKIQKRNIVVQYLNEIIEESISFLLNIGNNMNMVEPLRDFNGFSWNIIVKDIQDINYNLLYQNMIFLVGNKFIDKWSNDYDPIIDCFELFQNELEKRYGKATKERIITLFLQSAIELKALNDEEFRDKALKKRESLKKENKKFENREEFLLSQSKNKKEAEKEIKRLDKIISNKQLLLEEYQKRNDKLPLEKKIFSVRVLNNLLKEERDDLLEKIKQCNKWMKPKSFLENKKRLERELEIMDTLSEISYKHIYKQEIQLQKEIIKCMYINLKKATDKNDMIDVIYQYRYYNFLPISNNKSIFEIKGLEKSLNKLTKDLIKKAIDMKIITKILNNEEANLSTIKKLFLSKIITLEDINIKPLLKKDDVYLTVFDEDVEDTRIKIDNITKKDLNIKFNKKTKLFI